MTSTATASSSFGAGLAARSATTNTINSSPVGASSSADLFSFRSESPLFSPTRASPPSTLSSSLAAALRRNQTSNNNQQPQHSPLKAELQPDQPGSRANIVEHPADRSQGSKYHDILSGSGGLSAAGVNVRGNRPAHYQPHTHHFPTMSPSDSAAHSSSYRRALALMGSLPRSLGKSGSAALAASLSRSLGRTLAQHFAPKSPMMAPSPGRDLAHFSVLEDRFCKDFACCGISLATLHDLLQHFEECHVRVESDFENSESGADGADEEELPFEFDSADDDTMEMDLCEEVNPVQTPVLFAGNVLPSLIPCSPSSVGVVDSIHHRDSANFRSSIPSFGRGLTSPPTRATPSSLLNVTAVSSRSASVTPTKASSTYVSAFETAVIRQRRVSTPDFSAAHNESTPPSSSAAFFEKNSYGKRRRNTHSAFAHLEAPVRSPFAVASKEDDNVFNSIHLDENTLFDPFGGTPRAHQKLRLDHSADLTLAAHTNTKIKPEAMLDGSVAPELGKQLSPPTDAEDPSNADDRPFKCRVNGCSKAYKNPGGLKYHMRNGHAQELDDAELNLIVQKPYECPVPECAKRYKNLNGLKYHIEHVHIALLGGIAVVE
ncbi:hypothetical protein DFJ73DRAFT_760217 [Zopfochytrium polystomum]|nr:hypothetical protein DFJ73DRAFT_760217 [Zopfochytrium polystomum]